MIVSTGSAPDIAGKNIVNPTAMMLTGMHMLKYLGENAAADRIEKAVTKVIKDGRTVTRDLGGITGTSEFTDQVIAALK